MMQQQICQQDQMNQQQMHQQMVLCPVKVVYETQILMPPGEQIQPNQTFFINPQNTPPWAHNRLQNQVIYVQQMPNNIVPNIQQNIDPNQMYIQSYQYQMPQQILAQNPQEQRQMQLANMSPNINMMQAVPNVAANLQERTVQMTNFCQMPNQIVPNRQMAPNIGVTIPNQHQQINEMQRPFMNVRPQIHQYLNSARPQVVPNQTISIPQNMGQTFASLPQRPMQVTTPSISNIQRMVTPMPNTPPRMNTPTFSVPNPVQMPPKFVDSATETTDTISRHPIVNTAPKVANVQTYTMKNVQNRAQQYRHNVPNIGKLIQPTAHVNSNIYKERVVTNNSVATETPNFNRKRKSESPDEIHKKMLTNPATRDNAQTQTQTNDIRDTINSIQKNLLNENTILQISNSGAHFVKLNEIVNAPTTATATTASTTQTEKDKLLRNTVYTQAKGRVLTDKEMVPNEVTNAESQTTSESKEENKHYVTIVKIERLDAKEKSEEQRESKPENNKAETVKEEVKEEKSTEIPLQIAPEHKIEFKEKLLDDHQILTHVLDGYVIQESNIAFPIRKPVREKTVPRKGRKGVDKTLKDRAPIDLPLLPFHFLHLDNEEKKEEGKKEAKEECKKEEKQEEIVKDEIPEHPFINLQKAIVKSWAVEQLADHMAKNNWMEPSSIFRDHEIDGESLFMVSKSQLVHIGISEEYADIICEFIKN